MAETILERAEKLKEERKESEKKLENLKENISKYVIMASQASKSFEEKSCRSLRRGKVS